MQKYWQYLGYGSGVDGGVGSEGDGVGGIIGRSIRFDELREAFKRSFYYSSKDDSRRRRSFSRKSRLTKSER